ncbi:PilN domain-containing protein [Thiothrix nivea]|uniref:Fimbrial assembly family protein n=1 Tax=Thiothrix nivea (strain ATCC 35100 / DSM 5205 / JP2) TaxID=870187 RepID=A0A656HGB2_THINJ|nr:PilN domain-containing protein [Thiothrix nivea]EIJ36061.1 Fimbrial assembly family protein [Thiothrix nivea DSM 5205]
MRWWGEGLYESLPNSVRKLFRAELPRLVLQVRDGQQADALWVQDGKPQQRGSLSLQDASQHLPTLLPEQARNKPYQVELRLGKGQVLHLQHYFPEAVRENLQQVVGYQLDRLTPFTAENACFDARVVQHERNRKEVLADIYVLPRHVVERLEGQLQALGGKGMQILSVDGAHPDINLTASQDARQAQGWSMIPLYFFLAALVLSLLVPLGYKYRRLGQVETALADLRQSTAEQLAVRDKLLEAEDALKFLEDKRRTSPVALDVVEKLSTDIPEHTWLERLGIQGGKLEIRGESGKALTLIDTLEEAPEFSNVRFKSPVTRNKENGRDRFHIEATLEVPHAE